MNLEWSTLIIEELVRNQVSLICISPGARSAPLTVAAARNKAVNTERFYDERAAAFYALGYARATGNPAALIATSGTAVANYFPAIIEASMDHVPLIVITADRPVELQKCGANQTINQNNIFGDYIRWSFQLPAPDSLIHPKLLLTTVDQLVFRSRVEVAGPVHLNCMFRKPLLEEQGEQVKYPELSRWYESKKPYTQYHQSQNVITNHQKNELLERLQKASKGLVILGRMPAQQDQKILLEFLDRLNWPVFPDISSGLRWSKKDNIAHHFDLLLKEDAFSKEMQIDTLLHLGGAYLSASLEQFVKGLPLTYYLHVHENADRLDMFHKVSERYSIGVGEFCQSLISDLKSPSFKILESNQSGDIQRRSSKIENRLQQIGLESEVLTEPMVANILSQIIPAGTGLFLSNSMPIRYFSQFAQAANQNFVICSNRGASGIDGIISSAIGFAKGLKKPTTLVIGDIAFIHDLNSLVLLKESRTPITIILINNQGGGIFSFLPLAKEDDVFKEFFTQPHSLQFGQVIEGMGINYCKAKTPSQLKTNYERVCSAEQTTIIEINTKADENFVEYNKLVNQLLGDNNDC